MLISTSVTELFPPQTCHWGQAKLARLWSGFQIRSFFPDGSRDLDGVDIQSDPLLPIKQTESPWLTVSLMPHKGSRPSFQCCIMTSAAWPDLAKSGMSHWPAVSIICARSRIISHLMPHKGTLEPGLRLRAAPTNFIKSPTSNRAWLSFRAQCPSSVLFGY